ncbi:hypothetical protein [uncultured Jatrophihabitans sp.]|uniref:hypothetical protein n=1 Tax=uncultured Jatrophihabitans sp. TaxID=1610747 RepID=UPI0035CB0607
MRRRWWGYATGAGCAIAALVLAIALWPSDSSRPSHPKTPSPVAQTPTVRPTPSPTPTPVAIQEVRAAAPTRFTMTGPASQPYTINARVCGMANVRPLDPPGEQHHTVCWVKEDFGVAPGSTSATTYILGHAWAQDRLEVMNPASEPATKEIVRDVKAGRSAKLDGITIYPTTVLDGSTITLKTHTGVLTYTVKQVYGVAKSAAGNVRSLMNEKTPKRIVIITCAEAHGVDYDYDVIINAYLTRSRPLPT